jgi:hypothetical protein
MRTGRILASLGVACLAALLVPATPASAAGPPATTGVLVGQITGAGGINNTHTAGNVWGTDLGITWDDGAGHVLSAYGDTFGSVFADPDHNNGVPAGGDWRSNVLARSSDHRLFDGMSFDYLVTDRPGHAKELLASKKIDGQEITVIPTSGVSVGTRQYMGYMSVRHWGPPGAWDTNYGGIAYSDNGGTSWVKDAVTWPNTQPNAGGTDPFQMTALARRDGYVYLFGTPNGRAGSAHVARVPEASVLTKAAYQYWTGSAWVTGADTQAATIVPAQVAELSVQYNAFLGRWLMMYFDQGVNAIVLRSAPAPQGPWSDETVVVSGTAYPGLYGGFMHPWSSGPDLYFQVSLWGPYNVFLMRTKLGAGGDPTNRIADQGFEGTGTSGGPWACTGNCGTDRNLGFAHSQRNNGFVRYNQGWNDVHQAVSVTPNTTYRLTGWLRTSTNSDNGFFGIRTTGGAVLGEAHFTRVDAYTMFTATANSGANTSLVAYAGVWTDHGDIWLQLDDVMLFPA